MSFSRHVETYRFPRSFPKKQRTQIPQKQFSISIPYLTEFGYFKLHKGEGDLDF